MSPSSTVHGGQHDAKYVTFELLLHVAFVADEIWGFMLEPASTAYPAAMICFGRSIYNTDPTTETCATTVRVDHAECMALSRQHELFNTR